MVNEIKHVLVLYDDLTIAANNTYLMPQEWNGLFDNLYLTASATCWKILEVAGLIFVHTKTAYVISM